MFKIQILSVVWLFVFGAFNLEAHEFVSSTESSREPTTGMSCVNVLQKEMSRDETLAKMGSYLFPKANEHFRKRAIQVLWDEVPAIRDFLQKLAHKINYIHSQGLDLDKIDTYKQELINSILNFIQKLSEATIDIVPSTIGNSFVSEEDANRLTYQIKKLEKLIDQLDTTSPIESFMYTHIIDKAAEYLGDIEDVSEFDLDKYIFENDRDIIFGILNPSAILQSPEQKRYLLQQYQLLQRKPHQFTGIVHQTQNNHSVKTEQELREQGYSDRFIKGLDNAYTNLHLAQSLRTRSIDPINTHIPEFADLIDEHIDFIRKGIIDSQKLSDTSKEEKLELLDLLESKTQSYKDSEKVTYLWWLNFNLRLSIIATVNFDLSKHTNLSYSIRFRDFHENDSNDIDYDSFKEWIVGNDGLDFIKIASIFLIPELLEDSNNDGILTNIVNNLGLSLTLDEIKDLYLESAKDVSLIMRELIRRTNLGSSLNNARFIINAFYANSSTLR